MRGKVLFLIIFLQRVFSDEVHGICKNKRNCHECITDPAMCVWCSADNLKLEERCQPANSEKAITCSDDYTHNPSSNSKIQRNDDFSSAIEHVVQIKPQEYKIKTRVGDQNAFDFHYKAVQNYPVDLYFLLDASNSMTKIRDDLFIKSKDIYDSMRNFTTNLYLGYGAFVDKNVFPFINSNKQECYSFKHYLNLTPNLENFKTALNATEFRGNFDPPESGFDGLGQVMACKNEVGFRNQSRKLIIFITDNYSHLAGDGHVAGIINPFDGKCYVDKDGKYTKEKEMDYPSVGMISHLAANEQFTIFFIVTNYKDEYEVLANAISGAMVSTYGDASVSEQLKHFYQNIRNNIELDIGIAAEDKDHFDIAFDPDCSQKNNCAVVIGQEMHIHGLITLKEYYGKDNIEIPIMQKGLNEKLTLSIEVISNCECELKGNYEINSRDCNEEGDLQCGICNCREDRSGPTCACIINNTTISTDTTPCVKDGVECSRAGICICGSCSCRPGFGGDYCEVRTDNCQRDEATGYLCHGHGKCWNGTCQCNKMWEGERCECSKATDLCMNNGHLCNNRGKCKCGQCQCDPLPKWDVRESKVDFCSQMCDDCHARQCRALTDCVLCYNEHNNTEHCSAVCGDNLIFKHEVTDELKSNLNVCVNARVAFGCYANFSYAYDDEVHGIVLYWMSEPNCIESYFKYGAMSLLTAVVAGVAVMWALKLLTDAHDRAEYKRFLATPEDDGEVENPIYKQPVNNFQNPNFKRSFKFR